MSKLYFNHVYNNLEHIYLGFPVDLIRKVKKLLEDLNEINELFEETEIEKDLYRKRLIINISSSYLENSVDLILTNKYLTENELAERLLDKVRRTGMSGFNIIVIQNLMKIFDDDLARAIESTFNKKGAGSELKKNNIRFNQFRNECSHIGDLSDSEVSSTGVDIIYGYILEGLIIVYIIQSLINDDVISNDLSDVFNKFNYKLL